MSLSRLIFLYAERGDLAMAIFRIEKTADYTTMSNRHFKDKRLSLKSKGLLSQMLSLPENWDYTLKGLAHINRESIDAIRTAIWELEKAGYVKRRQIRRSNGKMAETKTENAVPAVKKKIGKTTYIVKVHFSKGATETMNVKIERMIRQEIQHN